MKPGVSNAKNGQEGASGLRAEPGSPLTHRPPGKRDGFANARKIDDLVNKEELGLSWRLSKRRLKATFPDADTQGD